MPTAAITTAIAYGMISKNRSDAAAEGMSTFGQSLLISVGCCHLRQGSQMVVCLWGDVFHEMAVFML